MRKSTYFFQLVLNGFFDRNLSQSAVPHSEISSINLISDYICKLPNKQIELRIFAVNDVS
jgi:hypothetical protein